MADFLPAFEKMIKNEGGYILHKNDGDRGGWTYAGIARNFHPDWQGWSLIDRGLDTDLTKLVRDFYINEFWKPINGDLIVNQEVAESIFDFGVNAGVKTAAKLAQLIVNATPDGAIGPKTLEQLNKIEPKLFILQYALAKLARYVEICKKDKEQERFLLWWSIRILKGLS